MTFCIIYAIIYIGVKQMSTINKKQFSFWRRYLIDMVYNSIYCENMSEKQEHMFKRSLLLYGKVAFFNLKNTSTSSPLDNKDDVYCYHFTTAGYIGFYPEYYKILITNPVLNEELTLTVDKDCKLVFLEDFDRDIDYVDTCHGGFSYLIDETARLLTDNTISINQCQFTKRIPTIFTASTDNELLGVMGILEKIRQGTHAIVARTKLDGFIKRLDASGTAIPTLQEFTEYQQYVLGQFCTAIGISSVWNMKRERVSAVETETSTNISQYNLESMLQRVDDQLQEVNQMFNTNYRVKFVSDDISDETDETDEPEQEGDSDDNSVTDS